MRSSFSAYFLFIIVITFIVLFTGYICISINQAKAFSVKNEIVNIIEKYEDDFAKHIPEVLDKVGYHNSGDCETDYTGFKRNGEKIDNGRDAAICIKQVENSSGVVTGYYYKVETFYQLDLPIIRSVFKLKSKGETKTLYSRKGYIEHS